MDLNAISRMTDVSTRIGVGYEFSISFFRVCKALSEYRLGRFTKAIEWAEKTVASPHLNAHGQAYAVLAMAHWRLGEKEAARSMIAKGEKLAPAQLPPLVAEEPGNAWLAWLFARISLDEANELIGSSRN